MTTLSDSYNRANGALATADTGQTYSILAGSVNIVNQRAVATNVRSIAVLDGGPGAQDGAVQCAVGNGGGYAAYFRVSDGSNWWRAIQRRDSYQYQSGTQSVIVGYQQVQTGTETYVSGTQSVQVGLNYTTSVKLYLQNPTTGAHVLDVNGQPYVHFRSKTNFYPASGYPSPTGDVFPEEPTDVPGDFGHLYRVEPTSAVYSTSAAFQDQPIYSTRPVYTSTPIYQDQPVYSTAYSITLWLEKCVGGLVSQVAQGTQEVTGGGTLSVRYQGSSIVATLSGISASATDAFNSTATKAGIGYAETSPLGNSDGVDNLVITVANDAPASPTLISPVGNAPVDRNSLQRFTVFNNDPNQGDTISVLAIRYRVNGDPTWITVTQQLPKNSYDFSAGTFISGSTYEWQAQITDAGGLTSPWSGSEFFLATTSPTAPVFVAPLNNATLNLPTGGVVTWSSPNQDAYQLRVVADLNGAADTTVIYSDTGIVVDSTSRSATVDRPVNGRTEHTQVRVRYLGLWSNYGDVRNVVQYLPPARANLTITTDNNGMILVAIAKGTSVAGQPVVAYFDLYRRRVGRTNAIRVAKNLPVGTYYDAKVQNLVNYEYQATAFAANGSSSDSGWTSSTVTNTPVPSTAGAYGAGAFGEGTYG